MSSADSELRALRRELLLTRAAAERAQLVQHFDQLEARTRGGQRLVGAALQGREWLRGASLAGAAASALRMARRQPWLVPALVTGLSRIGRTGAVKWIAVGAVVAAGVWWLRSTRVPTVSDPASDEHAED